MDAMTVHINSRIKDAAGFRALSEKMTAFVRDNEPGTTTYVWSLSDDEQAGFNVDGFDSTASFLAHMGNAQEQGFLDEFLAAVDIERVTVTGSPSAEAMPVLEQFGAQLLEPIASL